MPVAVLEPILDTYVDQGTGLGYGTATTMSVGAAGGNEKRAFVKWDLTPGVNIPAGATIIDVRFRLWVSALADAFYVTVRNLTTAFTEATTWATRPTSSAYFTTLFYQELLGAVANSQIVLDYTSVRDAAKKYKDVSELYEAKDVALLQLVRDWYSGAVTNHGIALQVSSTVGAWGWTFYTRESSLAHRRPILEVEYCTADTLPAAYSTEPEGFYGAARDALEKELVTKPTTHLYVEFDDGTEVDLAEDLIGTNGLRRHIPFVGEKLELQTGSFVLRSLEGKYSETKRESIFYAGRINGAYLRYETEVMGQVKRWRGFVKELIDHGDDRAEIMVEPALAQYLNRKLNTPRSKTAYGVSNHEGAPFDEIGPMTFAELLYEAAHNYAGIPDTDLNLDRLSQAKAVHTAQGMIGSAIWEDRTLGDEIRSQADAGLMPPYMDSEGDLAVHVWEPSDPAITDEPTFRKIEWWEDKDHIANAVTLNAKWDYPSEVDRASDGFEVTLTDHVSAAMPWGPRSLEVGIERLEAYKRGWAAGGMGHYILVNAVAAMQARFYLQALAYPFQRGRVYGGVDLYRYDLGSTFILRDDSRGIYCKVLVIGYDPQPGFGGQPTTVVMDLIPCNWPYPWKDYVNVLTWRTGAPDSTHNLSLTAPTPVDPVPVTVNSNSTQTIVINWTYTSGMIPPDGFIIFVNHGTTAGRPVPTYLSHTWSSQLIGGAHRTCTIQIPADNYATIAVGAYAATGGKTLLSVLADSPAAPDWVDVKATAGEVTTGNTPTNVPVVTGVGSNSEKDGSGIIWGTYTYAQGAIAADGLMLLWNIGNAPGVAVPTVNVFAKSADLPPRNGTYTISGFAATKYVTMGIVAYRNTVLGREFTAVVGHATWTDVRAAAVIQLDGGVQDGSGRDLTDMFSKVADDLDDAADGVTYKRVKATALTAGEVDLAQAGVLNKTADNIAETAAKKWAGETGADVTGAHTAADTAAVGGTAAGTVRDQAADAFQKSADNLDDVDDGATHGKVKLDSLTANEVDLAKVVGDLDDVSDGATYGRVTLASLTAGDVDLAKAVGDIDDVADGATYSRVKTTAIDGSGDVAVVADAPAPVSGTITKVLHLSAASLTPIRDDTEYQILSIGTYIAPAVKNVYQYYYGVAPLPVGATIIRFSARLYKVNAADIVEAWLRKPDNAGGNSTSISQHTLAVAGAWTTMDSGALAEVTAGLPYLIMVGLFTDPGSALTQSARFMRVEIEYTVPTFDISL